MAKKNNVEETEIDGVANLKIGYEAINKDYILQIERLKEADNKSNMLLVFNAAILVLLSVIFPITIESCWKDILLCVSLVIFGISMLATSIMLIIAIFPRKLSNISSENFVKPDFYNCRIDNFMGKIMENIHMSIVELSKTCENKHKYNKIAMVLTICNIVFITISIILKYIGG